MTQPPIRPHWYPAYVGLGSNLADPPRQIARALDALAALPGVRLVQRSPLYASPPMGPADQPDFVNAVAGLLVDGTPETLLAQLQRIEQDLGRTRERHWGPRIIDLDLLVFGGLRRDQEALQLPHPGIAERAFVLQPLADLAPDLVVPGVGRVTDLLAEVDLAGLRRLTE